MSPRAQAKNLENLEFSTFRLGSHDRAVLIIGGIQGDEPGGFSAATLLATHYEIVRGELWVVPNLNFPSIIRRSRGLHGDMNRKFAKLDTADPEFDTIRKVQELIRDPKVALVLNLHDGSGYYRPVFENKLCNPHRWGQSIIIDQDNLPGVDFMGELGNYAEKVKSAVNAHLSLPLHYLHVHNTRTAEGDVEMEKSLSYFAIKNGKAAFGLEASKEFPVEMRVYCHLLMAEEFMRHAGMTFKRDFELSPVGVNRALRSDIGISFADNRVFLPLEDVRPAINFLPVPPNVRNNALTSKPIMAILPCRSKPQALCVHYGNRMVTAIKPEWREIDRDLSVISVNVDGVEKKVPFGCVLAVKEYARVHAPKDYRVNAIGYASGNDDESGELLRRKDFRPGFSLDRQNSIFRVEVYRSRKLAGIILLNFSNDKVMAGRRAKIMPDSPGPESELGF